MTKLPVILIFGPTAVGKTDLLASLFSGTGEVISADSMQVYRGLDIGTAKPESDLTEKVPHHLIDICDPDTQFDAAAFTAACDKLIPEILFRGKTPVISGGTAFYFKNFLYGMPEVPASDPEIRNRLEAEVLAGGLAPIRDRLKEIDPVTADRLAPGDKFRILRALEVHEISGRPLSSFHQPETVREKYRPLVIGLDRPRDELYSRIDLRVDLMFRAGLVEEVKTLLTAGWTFDDPGFQAIGYKEFGLMSGSGCLTLSDCRQQIQQNSRRYAKRQLTFFRSFSDAEWYLLNDPASPDHIRNRVEEFWTCENDYS